MSYKYVIDSYAWVEYFNGSEKGKIAQKYIEGDEGAASAITLAELQEKYTRESKEFEDDLRFILARVKIIAIDAELALAAGKINAENKKKIKNWGMADALILATAQKIGARVVTGDEHFRTLNAIML